MKKHLNIQISGKVQGVGFRFFVAQEARSLKITGFVKNENNGTLSIEAEAFQEILNVFEQKCRIGPARSHIDRFIVSESEPENYTCFEIR